MGYSRVPALCIYGGSRTKRSEIATPVLVLYASALYIAFVVWYLILAKEA